MLNRFNTIEEISQENQIKGNIYCHYKGRYYLVRELARCAQNPDSILVVYEALYSSEEFGNHCIWVRPLDEFLSTLEDGTPRFRPVTALN